MRRGGGCASPDGAAGRRTVAMLARLLPCPSYWQRYLLPCCSQYDIEIVEVDITAPGQEQWKRKYAEAIPVVHMDGSWYCEQRVDRQELEADLTARGTYSFCYCCRFVG